MTTTMECTPLSQTKAPTHLTLATLHRELNTYAMGVTSNRGGGNHGHLALVTTAAAYLALTNQPFDIPVHPGPHPQPGATQPIITENNRLHTAAIAEHKTYKDTENALKQMILKAVPLTYIDELQDQLFGFAQITPVTILQHLDTNYGTVTLEDLAHNLETMHAKWSADKPIEVLWAQITQARSYAAAHDDITDKAAIMSAINNIETTGLFADDLKMWRNMEIATQTWPKLKQHFNQANRNRLMNATISNAGYTAKGTPTAPTEDNPRAQGNDEFRNWKYCWTHGLNRSHNSMQCRVPADGHNKEATINNMAQGCRSITLLIPRTGTRFNNRRQPLAPVSTNNQPTQVTNQAPNNANTAT